MQTVVTTRVRYAETDAMGIVYHANYLIWFEMARTELFRNLGIPYTKFEGEGLALAVVEANLRYKAAAKYDYLLEIKAKVSGISSRKVVFDYQIHANNELLCEGKTVHLFVNTEGKATSAVGYPIWQEVKKVFALRK